MATVSHLGMMQGLMEAGHTPPPGTVILEQKYCENCTASFVRPRPILRRAVQVSNAGWDGCGGGKRAYSDPDFSTIYVDRGKRFCNACIRRGLAPLDLEDYRDMLPTEAQQKHSHYLPHYDDSIVPPVVKQHMRSATVIPIRRRHYYREPLEEREQWKRKVIAALISNEGMTYEQLCDMVPGVRTPVEACMKIRNAGLRLVKVGEAERRALKGRAPGIYMLEQS
jgi:hypothetical protein